MITSINEFKKYLNESFNRYFDEHESVDDYNINIVTIDPISKGDYDEHRLTVTGLPDLRRMNTRNGNFEEMLYFVAKYSVLKDDEFADYIKQLPLKDDVTIIDDNQTLTFAASDLSDFSRNVSESIITNEAKRPPYEIIAEKDGVLLVDVGFSPIMLFKNDLEKLAANNFKDANLMNNYFSGTAIVGEGETKSPKTTDYSSPLHKGQVIDNEKFEDAEEFDFKYNRNINNKTIETLCDMYAIHVYQPGLKVLKTYLH